MCRSVLLANWERVLCCSSALEVSVSTHTHCSRTNENTPRHLPKRDTPSPSPCPSTLVPASPFTLFISFLFLPSCPLHFFHPPTPLPPPFPIFSISFSHILILFSLFLSAPPLHLCHSCFFCTPSCQLPLSIPSKSVEVCLCCGVGGSCCRVKVLPCSDRRLSECFRGRDP